MISALIDASSSALLTLSANPSIVTFLGKSPLEAEVAYYVNHPNHPTASLAKLPAVSYPLITWDWPARRFVATKKELVTESLQRRSELATWKAKALGEIGAAISRCRYSVWRELPMQETVYILKRMQAQRYKDKKYPEKDLMHYPYVAQYADLSGLAPRAAADEILFKAQLDDETLAKTEYLRMKYFNLVRNAVDTKTVGVIVNDFRLDLYQQKI